MTDETISATPPKLEATTYNADEINFHILLAAILGIANVLGLLFVFLSDTYRVENVMGQLLNAATRTNGLLTLAVIDLLVIGIVLMVRR